MPTTEQTVKRSKRKTVTLSVSYPREFTPLIEQRCKDQARSKSSYITALIMDDIERAEEKEKRKR
jgi:hypothetical protein